MKLNKYKEIEKNIEYWQKLFLDELQTFNKSKNTLKTYKRILDEFKEFCYIEQTDIGELSLYDINKYFINGYINYLKDKNLSDSTLSLHVAILKHFFKYVSENNSDYEDILSKIEKIKIKTSQKEIITFTSIEWDKIKFLLTKNIEKAKSYERIKKGIALLLIYYTGMRADEVLHLKKDSFELDNGSYKIKLLGKGNKERFNYIQQNLIERYLKKLFYLQKKANLETDFLFVTKQKNIIHYNNLLKYNHNLLKNLEITNPQKKGLHIYRHTFASKLVQKGVNMQIIKDWLGHSSIVTTSMFYAKADEKSKMEICAII